MNKDQFKIFKSNTEAIPTNRGFYYQYLITLKKWIESYINGNEVNEVYAEVEEDIKEINGALIFTQVKCYTSSFSFSSKEIKSTLFNFYMIFLEYESEINNLEFHFYTNTDITKKEKLLSKWCSESIINDQNLRSLCVDKVKDILLTELTRKKNLLLKKSKDDRKKQSINEVHDNFILRTNSCLEKFVLSIRWQFKKESPEEALKNIENNILNLLKDSKFRNKPPKLLINVLLSEIYKSSSNPIVSERLLNISKLNKILNESDNEIHNYIDNKFTKLIGTDHFYMQVQIDELKKETQYLTQELTSLKINSPNELYDKELTFIPKIDLGETEERNEIVSEINTMLESEKIVVVSGIGGAGKTTSIKLFLKQYFEEYNHIIWIDRITQLKNDFCSNENLITNLNLHFTKENTEAQKFDFILNKINKIKGRNLLIVDNLINEKETIIRKELNKINNWEILITSREKISGIKQYNLPQLDNEKAVKIFNTFCPSLNNNKNSNISLDYFLSYIQYNPLLIKLCAKTIFNSLDLNLDKLYEYFKKQELTHSELEIDIEIEESGPTQLFHFLKQTFDLSALSQNEKGILEILAYLPPIELNIFDFIRIYGDDLFETNKIQVTNTINSLDKLGWVERKGDYFKTHKLIQEVVRYDIKMPNFFFIIFLCHRIKEANQNPTLSKTKYVKYAESILDNIKEENRESIQHPMIVLENNLLESYKYLGETTLFNLRIENLVDRAKTHLDSKDYVLGVIYNNYSSYLNSKNKNELALEYVLKAVQILELDEKTNHVYLTYALTNLSVGYLKVGKLNNSRKEFLRLISIRKRYNLLEDSSHSYSYNFLGDVYLDLGKYDEAIKMFQTAIEIFNTYKKHDSNEFYLSIYFSNLSTAYLLSANGNLALENQLVAANILEKLELLKNPYLKKYYKLISIIYQHIGDFENANLFNDKIINFANNLE